MTRLSETFRGELEHVRHRGYALTERVGMARYWVKRMRRYHIRNRIGHLRTA